MTEKEQSNIFNPAQQDHAAIDAELQAAHRHMEEERARREPYESPVKLTSIVEEMGHFLHAATLLIKGDLPEFDQYLFAWLGVHINAPKDPEDVTDRLADAPDGAEVRNFWEEHRESNLTDGLARAREDFRSNWGGHSNQMTSDSPAPDPDSHTADRNLDLGEPSGPSTT